MHAGRKSIALLQISAHRTVRSSHMPLQAYDRYCTLDLEVIVQ